MQHSVLDNRHEQTFALLQQQTAKPQESVQDLAKFKLAVERASDMVMMLDSKGILLYANRACETTTGYTLEEILGRKVGTVWHSPLPAAFYRKLWRTIKHKKQIFESDMRYRHKNGQEHDSHMTMTPILDEQGDILFFVALERDITREKEIDRAKTDFVFFASHQLRTPASIIKWSVEDILMTTEEPLNGEQKQTLLQIMQADTRIIRAVETMLRIARFEAGSTPLAIHPLEPLDALKQELLFFSQQIHHKNLQTIVHAPTTLPRLYTDQGFLQTILHNLLSNAIKYTPDNGTITATITATPRTITFKIQDTGCGIPKNQQSRIFSKMFRADNVQHIDADGNGLGLYLVQLLVKHLHGKIWFRSTLNRGTTFYVKLPLQLRDESALKQRDKLITS